MSFPILLNQSHQVSQHQFQYRFSRPIDFSNYEMALGSVSIYYSWRAITAARGNNTFQLIWPTGATTQTFTVTLPDGTYSATSLDAFLQYWSIQHGLYLVNNTTGAFYYFLSVAENPSAYAIQFNMLPYKAVSGYSPASGALAFSTSGYTPQLAISNAEFGKIVGYSPATYPSAQQGVQYSVTSNLVPQLDPVSSVTVGCSNLLNPLANNSQVLHSFSSSGVQYGSLITSQLGQGLSYCPMQGHDSQITISFYDQNMMPLQLIDPNLCIRLLMRPSKNPRQ